MVASENIASWQELARSVDQHPDAEYWIKWKNLAHRLLQYAEAQQFNKYIRAGRSMNHLTFSTLDHHGLRDEPRVTVELKADGQMRIAFGRGNLYFSKADVEYTLPFDEACLVFHRFLNQLWQQTMPEPLPDELRQHS